MEKEETGGPPLITVVLPSYNDRPIIDPYYRAITAHLADRPDYDYELIYVDDGSSDGSPEELCRLATSDAKVTYIELYRNFGQQRALFAGLEASRGDFVVTLDGDYQYEPEVITQLVAAMGATYDLASGIRIGRQDTFSERVSSQIGNQLINKALGVEIKDFGSVKAFSRTLVDKILSQRHHFSDVYPSAFSLHPKMVEVEVAHKDRPYGTSHWNIWMRFKVYMDLYINYGDDQFYGVFKFGVFNIIGSVIFALLLLIYKAVLTHQASVVEILGIALLWCLMGVSFAIWSITMSYIVRIYKQNIHEGPIVIRQQISSHAQDE